MATRDRKPAENITFRLSAQHMRQLEQAAAELGMSRGEYARSLLVAALSNTTAQVVETKLGEIQKEIKRSRLDLAKATVALLVQAAKMPPKDAEQWVRERLLS